MWESVIKFATGLIPGGSMALTVAPWALAGLLFTGLAFEHEELLVAKAGLTAAQAQTVAAVNTCQQEAATEAAKETAAAAAQIAAAQAQANAATAALMASRADAAKVQQQAQKALEASLGSINTQAAKPGQDGTIPPVLAGEFQ